MSLLAAPGKLYWVTRDSDETGALSDQVAVWDARPRIKRRDGGVGICWKDSTEVGSCYGSFPFAEVACWGHTMPDTDHECIRVERG